MFFQFFDELRAARIPVTLKEYLALMDALSKDVIDLKVEEFYYLSRTALVKDERNLDKFDRVFGHVFKGLEGLDASLLAQIPEEWLKALTEKFLTEDEKKQIEALGGLGETDGDAQAASRRTEEASRGRFEDDRLGRPPRRSAIPATTPKACASARTSPVTARAVKVWDKREYKNLDDSVELGTRNIKVALRRLRKWAREGAENRARPAGTIKDTASKGYLDLRLIPERHNTVKVLLFFDIGGSMDAHIKLCEELFSAAKTEFKHMDFLLLPQLPL